MIKESVLLFCEEFKDINSDRVDGFYASDCWFTSFKEMHGISAKIISGESFDDSV